mmetsp:Transcript_4714/g.10459  ORF Transcript_4714/g.10459 Transcript_4714/m.10459 type:complete len:315 (+) Transcript_4714:3-947(+)
MSMWSCCLRVQEEGLDGSVDGARAWSSETAPPRGCASACFEPTGAHTKVSWNNVGEGKGAYNAMEAYNYVGEGRGNFQAESAPNARKTALLPGGRRPKPAFYYCGGLMCLLAVVAIVHYAVTGLVFSNTPESVVTPVPSSIVTTAALGTTLVVATPAPTTSKPAPAPTSNAAPKAAAEAPARPESSALTTEAPKALHIIPICSVGYPGLSKWCCEHYHRNCPATAASAGTPPPPAAAPMTTMPVPTQTMPGCGQMCTIDGTAATCGARVQWSAKNEFAIHASLKASACSLAHKKVLTHCPGCSLCPLKGAGCKV